METPEPEPDTVKAALDEYWRWERVWTVKCGQCFELIQIELVRGLGLHMSCPCGLYEEIFHGYIEIPDEYFSD